MQLRAKVDTVIKQSTDDSTRILDPRMKFSLTSGSELLITSCCRAPGEHLQIELLSAVNGTTRWFAYSPHVEIQERDVPERTLITYNVLTNANEGYRVEERFQGKLKANAKLACNFWNRFVLPKSNIVLRVGTYSENSTSIASSWAPYIKGNTIYGMVAFNTKYLNKFSGSQTAGTIIHEIGHTLGFGWDKWEALYNRSTGRFKKQYAQDLPELESMLVEVDDGGGGTRYSHWDELQFDKEVMTGWKDMDYEDVLPVTIKVMRLLGHTVLETLSGRTSLAKLIEEAGNVVFSKAEAVKKIDLEYFEKSEIAEKRIAKQ
jgi:hypothetical protein